MDKPFLKKALLGGGAAIVVVLAGIVIFKPHDSPVEVAGGSIYASVYSRQSWNYIDHQHVTVTSANNIDQILLVGVDGVTSPVPVPNGWVIKISNRHQKDKSEYPEAVVVCSDPDCTGASLGDGHTIYFKARPDARWKLKNNQLRFHAHECDGADDNDNENRDCDFLFRVAIESPEGNEIASGRCKKFYGDGLCTVGIGKNP
ncbi:MAG TPA: hypothetical protein VIX42_07685 [Edaphobacter sp.]